MIRSLYTTVSSLISLENKQNTITSNMANANTTGYKKEDLIMKSFDEVLIQNKDKIMGNKNVKQRLGTLSLGAEIDTVNTKYTQGDLKSTDRMWDFGINGRGFFTVQTEAGQVFTRDGNFIAGNDGYLTTTTGDKVLGRNTATGAVEPVYVGNSEFALDENNGVVIDGAIGQVLLTADFEDYDSLEKMGNNYYTGENPIFNAAVDVRQRYLEGSNVNVTTEMVDMLTTMRNFETNQKILTMIDESLGKAASEVGAVRG